MATFCLVTPLVGSGVSVLPGGVRFGPCGRREGGCQGVPPWPGLGCWRGTRGSPAGQDPEGTLRVVTESPCALQNQLLTKGMVILRDKIRFYEGEWGRPAAGAVCWAVLPPGVAAG